MLSSKLLGFIIEAEYIFDEISQQYHILCTIPMRIVCRRPMTVYTGGRIPFLNSNPKRVWGYSNRVGTSVLVCPKCRILVERSGIDTTNRN